MPNTAQPRTQSKVTAQLTGQRRLGIMGAQNFFVEWVADMRTHATISLLLVFLHKGQLATAQDGSEPAPPKLSEPIASEKPQIAAFLEKLNGKLYLQKLNVNGTQREYYLYIPSSKAAKADPKPLIMHLHGTRHVRLSPFREVERAILAMAAKQKVVAVFPTSPAKSEGRSTTTMAYQSGRRGRRCSVPDGRGQRS